MWCVLDAIVCNPAAGALLADAPPQMDPLHPQGASLPCVALCTLWQVKSFFSVGTPLVYLLVAWVIKTPMPEWLDVWRDPPAPFPSCVVYALLVNG